MNKLLLLTVLVLAVGAAQAQTTLAECVHIALAHNPGLKAAESEAGMADEEVRQADTALLPALDFSGSYRHQSAIPELSVPPITVPFWPDPISVLSDGMTLGTKDVYDFRMTLTQPLFTGFRLGNRKAAAQAAASGRYRDLERQRADLIYKVEAAYAAVLKTRKYIEIAQSARDQVARHLQDAETLVAQGLARRDELLRVEVKRSEAELALVRAENGHDLARAALENLLGQSLPAELALADMPILAVMPVQTEAGADLQVALALAAQHRPELATVTEAKAAGEAAKKIARGGRWPSVAAFGTYAYGKPGLDFTKKEAMDYWLVGVGAEWNLWNWGKTSSQIQQAELKLRSIAENERQLSDAIQLDVKQAHLRRTEMAKSLAVAAHMVRQADASYEVMERQYKQGVASHSDYFDAQSELTRAKLIHAEALIEEGLAQANWRRAVGLGEQAYSH